MTFDAPSGTTSETSTTCSSAGAMSAAPSGTNSEACSSCCLPHSLLPPVFLTPDRPRLPRFLSLPGRQRQSTLRGVLAATRKA
eukprot:7367546-Alexandrium_andersonii.AAC.1